MAAVDEAWKVQLADDRRGRDADDGGTGPAAAVLVSTAHRLTTDLMLRAAPGGAGSGWRTGDGDLLVEWSAPPDAPIWMMWRRGGWRRRTGRRSGNGWSRSGWRRPGLGELDPDAEEPDPEQSFRAQWLNQWPRRRTEPPKNIEDLLPAGLWAELAEPGLWTDAPVIVALEDDYGRGAAVAAVAPLGDGRLEVDGWRTDDWDSPIADVERLAMTQADP